MEQLIPHYWFSEAHSGLLLIYAVLGLYFLQLGAEWLVEGASSLAYRLGMPEVIIGATIVSLGTTMPECAVSVLAAFNGNSGLALGNAVGSVIADTALIFGIGCLLMHLPADRFLLTRQGWVQFGSALLLAAICYATWVQQGEMATLGRPIGLFFLGLLVIYLGLSIQWARQHPQNPLTRVSENIVEHAEAGEEVHVADEHVSHKTPLQLLLLLGAGLFVIVFAGHATIESVTVGAQRMGVPQIVVAATLVAIGTSLPELVVGLMAIRRGHPELLIGNIIGADILNILFVIGAAATAAPLPLIDPSADVPEIFLWIHLPTMLLVLVYFRFCIARANHKGCFDRWMGFPLLVIYAIYITTQFVITTVG